MNPPPIGESLSAGWNAFKTRPVELIVGMLLANLVFMIPLVGHALGLAGLFYMSLKAVRGEKVEIVDVFAGFRKPLDQIVIGLLQMLGFLLCCVGVLITTPLFAPGLILIADKGVSWQEAKDRCWQEVRPAWPGWVGLWLVILLLNLLGAFACIIGAYVTGPIGMCAFAYAYDRTLGRAV